MSNIIGTFIDSTEEVIIISKGNTVTIPFSDLERIYRFAKKEYIIKQRGKYQ